MELDKSLETLVKEEQELITESRSLLNKNKEVLDTLSLVQELIREQISESTDEMLEDIRTGKVYLVDAQTHKPKTVAVFANR